MRLLAKPELRVVTPEEVQASLPAIRRRVWKPLRGSDAYNSHPATGLTADGLLSMYRAAEGGQPLRQFDTFDDFVEIGGHLRGLIDVNNEEVAGSDWVLLPGRRDKPSELAAAALEEQLRAGVGFREFMEHQLSAEYYGMAATNLIWDYVEGVIVPVEFVNVAHRRFASPSAERADEVMLVGGETFAERIPLEWGQWALTVFGRNPWSFGKLRTCGWWEMFKRWSMRDWQVFAEMFGLPLVLGYYQEGASQASRDALTSAVQAIGDDGFAVLSAMTEIVVKDTVRSGDSSTVYPRIMELCEQQQSKVLVGSTTATDTGGAVGSYNLGAIHATRAYKKARRRATRLAEMFAAYIGKPYIAWNGFDKAAAPQLKVQITRDSFERAQTIDILAELMDIDEDQMREEFSLRVPAPGKGVRKLPKAAAPVVPPAPAA